MREQWVLSMSEQDRSDFLRSLRPGDVISVHREGRCDVVAVLDGQLEVRTQVGLHKVVRLSSVVGRWV